MVYRTYVETFVLHIKRMCIMEWRSNHRPASMRKRPQPPVQGTCGPPKVETSASGRLSALRLNRLTPRRPSPFFAASFGSPRLSSAWRSLMLRTRCDDAQRGESAGAAGGEGGSFSTACLSARRRSSEGRPVLRRGATRPEASTACKFETFLSRPFSLA